jgi:polyphenol oxidase
MFLTPMLASFDAALITPNWPLPHGVRAAISTRQLPGYSQFPYQSFNLGDHVGDVPEHVQANRVQLQQMLGLSGAIPWLTQVHGTVVHEHVENRPVSISADACYTRASGVACAVLTADCLPLLLCDASGSMIGAIHAGWRGLLAGVIEASVAKFPAPHELLVYLGPSIGPSAFEVGPEVRAAFLAESAGNAAAFATSQGDRFLANLPLLAKLRLQRLGVQNISESEQCTVREPALFYSHRRENGKTGRFASLIWRV